MASPHDVPLGIAGRITRTFVGSPLVPLLLLASLAIGALALSLLPREEEPQISVPMVDVFVEANGLAADDAVELVTKPLEALLRRLPDVEHVYTQTVDDRVVATARFFVGTREDDALLRVHAEIRAHYDQLPVGIPEPLIVGRGINDVAILVLTLSPRPDLHEAALQRWDRADLGDIADELLSELAKVQEVGRTYLTGATRNEIRIEPDPAALALYGVTLEQLAEKVRNANRSELLGRVRQGGAALDLLSGQTLTGVPDAGLLLVTTRDGRPVYLKDVANVRVALADQDARAWQLVRDDDAIRPLPVVSIAIAKREGANAVTVAADVMARLALVQGSLLPDDLVVDVVRNYGETAAEKASELFGHLVGATLTIVLLIVLFIGWKEGVVTLVIIPATILLTFAASYFMGYTINRVSLFALIFAIGILVDDAIVVVENIARHWRMDPEGDRIQVAIRGVAEVGNPTIVATFTIVTALLPMLFVSGLMGPYMSPIPINASAGMVISQIVAFVVAPWLAFRLLRHKKGEAIDDSAEQTSSADGVSPWALKLFNGVLGPFLGEHVWRRRFLGLGVVVLAIAAASLPVFLAVILKMLPFDNKSELQVVVDMPERTPMEQTQRVLTEMGHYLETVDEVSDWQAYAGTASPINFNGLVRQYYLRGEPYQGDIQVNLASAEQRDRPSHDIAQSLRGPLTEIAQRHGANVKIVEVPPGPPVMSPVVAEVYAADAFRRAELANLIADDMATIEGLVDIDTTLEAPTRQWEVVVDRARAARLGVSQAQVVSTLQTALGGAGVSYLHDDHAKYPVPIRVILAEGDKAQPSALLSIKIRNRSDELIPLASVAQVREADWMGAIHHKDLLPVTYVTADMAGDIDSPLYGMFRMVDLLKQQDEAPEQFFIQQPPLPEKGTLKWDGEWQITYETFRDMGAAYSVGVFMIFVLLVAQFRSYILPLVIMAPIPLTLIGIMPGHALLGKEFTATSMIGMIALAGIIVRNSILLVVFIRQLLDEGMELDKAVVLAGAVRVKPIALTAVSAVVGAYFILSDPIFNGLAISLIFGLAMSTLFTVIVVPLLYYTLARCKWV